MGNVFNADEIFEIAEQIERNGARFYRSAAKLDSVSNHKWLLEDLARREEEHERLFAQLRTRLNDGESFDPESEGARYLQAFANGHIFDPNADPEKELQGSETLTDIFKKAIAKERDSIAFYMGIKAAITKNQDSIEAVIKEEMKHVTQLSDELNALQG